MSSVTVTNANALIGGAWKLCNIKLVDNKIRGVMPAGPAYGKVYDAKGNTVIPGLIDIHVHGAKGFDFNEISQENVPEVRDFLASCGVTTFLPTLRLDSEENYIRSVMAISKARGTMDCSQIYGIHLEGPFVSDKFCKEEEKIYIKKGDYPLFKRIQDASGGIIKLLCVAPEMEGVPTFIERVVMDGIRVSLGHTTADYHCAEKAFETGAVSATHLFSKMPEPRALTANATTAILESDCFCEVVFDEACMDAAVARVAYKTKGCKRMIAVSNGKATAGMAEGIYEIDGKSVVIRNGEARELYSKEICSSMLTAIQALKNAVKMTRLPLEQVVPFFTENPARMLGIFHAKGSIDVGKDADLVIMDNDYRVITTISQGQPIFERVKQ